MIAALFGQALLGWLFADLVGGLLHYVEDRQMLPAFLDKHVGLPNRLHHSDPQGVTRDHNILRRNSTTIAVALPTIILLYRLTGATAFWFAASLGGLISYEAHRWAHSPRRAPAWVHVLQEVGLLQSPKHHACHHRPPHDGHFCILSNWLNPFLDSIGFWRLVGLLLRRGKNLMNRTAAITIIAIALLLAACAGTPPVQTKTVEVDIPVATQPIKASDIPPPPAPLGKRPADARDAADAAFAAHCRDVAFIIRAFPLLLVSAGLAATQAPPYPECEKH